MEDVLFFHQADPQKPRFVGDTKNGRCAPPGYATRRRCTWAGERADGAGRKWCRCELAQALGRATLQVFGEVIIF